MLDKQTGDLGLKPPGLSVLAVKFRTNFLFTISYHVLNYAILYVVVDTRSRTRLDLIPIEVWLQFRSEKQLSRLKQYTRSKVLMDFDIVALFIWGLMSSLAMAIRICKIVEVITAIHEFEIGLDRIKMITLTNHFSSNWMITVKCEISHSRNDLVSFLDYKMKSKFHTQMGHIISQNTPY